MLINHKYKFIFLKTRKTAGTSIEIALSKFCDSNDIITKITKEDEIKRQELGFRGPQNYNIPLRFYNRMDWLKLLKTGKRKQFFNHIEASSVKKLVGEEVWKSYFKFCFERNPFDKAISNYYWSTRSNTPESRPKIEDYLNSAPIKHLSNWNNYTINDKIVVDFVGNYENLNNDLEIITDKLGLPEKLSLPRAKGNSRKNQSHYSTVLNDSARTRIEIVCAKEITAFNYQWVDFEE
ncbi:sulfotransferase family 2 domain-containing protein [Okeania sp. SIO1I7]|uniref:sulfotransferase family 2 domain-containing protein n=1 Tax=Okeania sp. SIO1I7 TaxID=2607772 RepID=UPI0013F81AB6|nr:sulfotransferase family 2 domain-containing protein [Okeania sp. SIO1I7]NET28114.1 sulfotransferase family protein [Okeania sp. SIO1I7]